MNVDWLGTRHVKSVVILEVIAAENRYVKLELVVLRFNFFLVYFLEIIQAG